MRETTTAAGDRAAAASSPSPVGGGAGIPPEAAPGALDEATTARVEKLIEEEEGAQNRFTGLLGWAATGVALAMALFHLWAAWSIVPTTTLRFVHVGFAMALGFLLFPVARRWRSQR